MTSRLSSLLVRDGIVTVKRMERAFQRQVMTGGTLDTILLEMGLVPEGRLVQYLALASGLPPAAPADEAELDRRAASRLDREQAARHRVVPLGFDGDALRVVTHDPVDLHGLETLADELGVAIQPFVAPEYRFAVLFHRVYGGAIHPRLGELAARLASAAPSVPVGKPRSVEIAVEAAQPEAVPIVAPVASRQTQPMSGEAMRQHRDEVELQAPAAPVVPASPSPTPALAPSPAPIEPPAPGRTVEMIAPPVDDELPARDVSPLALADARVLLGVAEERDAIFEILLRAVRGHTYYAGLLTIQGGAAVGRRAIIGDEPDEANVSQVLIPLDVPSAFHKAYDQGAPYIGPIASGDAAIDAMIRRLGGVMPPAALILPIAVKGRVVALVVGHRGADALSISEVSELLPLAGLAADALGRVLKRKRAETSPGARAEAAVAPAAAGAAAIPPVAATVAAPAGGDGLGAALDRLEAAGPDDREAALAAALALGAALAPALGPRFPGRLDETRLPGRRRRAAEYGPLCDLVVRLGDAALPVVVDGLASPRADVRYYAARCAGELGHAGLRRLLVDQLFDDDEGVRQAALDALGALPIVELDGELVALRQALLGADPARARHAAAAAAELGDVAAIPALLEALDRGVETGPAAVAALTRLCKQDFGPNSKKWRQWWDKNKGRHRIEWMLEGLGHKDPEIRRMAIDDLRRLTGEYFGYHHDLAKRERENARQRWILWWHETGRRRFIRQAPG